MRAFLESQLESRYVRISGRRGVTALWLTHVQAWKQRTLSGPAATLPSRMRLGLRRRATVTVMLSLQGARKCDTTGGFCSALRYGPGWQIGH